MFKAFFNSCLYFYRLMNFLVTWFLNKNSFLFNIFYCIFRTMYAIERLEQWTEWKRYFYYRIDFKLVYFDNYFFRLLKIGWHWTQFICDFNCVCIVIGWQDVVNSKMNLSLWQNMHKKSGGGSKFRLPNHGCSSKYT